MKLQDKLDAMREKSKSNLPPETAAAMHKATEELAHSGIMERVLKPGNEIPHFTLLDENENEISSEDMLKKGPLVVTFYRGLWWPYCNAELDITITAHKPTNHA